MGASDAAATPAAFLDAYDRKLAEQGGRAAAEMFLRTVLGDAAFTWGDATYGLAASVDTLEAVLRRAASKRR